MVSGRGMMLTFAPQSNKMENAYIIDGIRTAVGSFGGSLAFTRPDDLAALVIAELLKRNLGIDPAYIDEVIFGCANQAGEDNRNVARMAALLSGLPDSVPAETVNILCASGMAAIANAARNIKSGDGHLFIAGGVESMTRAPFIMAKSATAFSRDVQVFDSSIGWRFVNPALKKLYGTDSMGETAENVSELYKVNRQDQDAFAVRSHQKAASAAEKGRFIEEIVPVTIPQKKGEPLVFQKDEFIKPHTTIETLAKLRPAFKESGTVTAGNSSGINDGAAALLIASESFSKKHHLKPLARIVASAISGVAPRIMGIGPVTASIAALKKAGISFDDLSVIELNEAFAAQGLASLRQWGLSDTDSRINPNGGAIAIGHPLGMSGARLVLTAARELHHNNGKFALCTMCVGVGQGYAMVIERL